MRVINEDAIKCNHSVAVWDPVCPNLLLWRTELGLKHIEAANWLGISVRAYTYFQSGKHGCPWSLLLAADYIYKHKAAVKKMIVKRDLVAKVEHSAKNIVAH